MREHSGTGFDYLCLKSNSSGDCLDPGQIYVDASVQRGKTGVGVVLMHGGVTRLFPCALASLSRDSTDAELKGIAIGLHRFAQLFPLVKDVQVFTDASMTMDHLGRSTPTYDSVRMVQAQIHAFDSLSLTWIPREHNATANYLARFAVGLPAPRTPTIPHNGLRREIHVLTPSIESP
jgi:ribonuclease HI